MNLATYTSMAACLVGLLAAVITLSIASASGMRGLRIFSFSCAVGALYAAANATLASGSFELSFFTTRAIGTGLGLAVVQRIVEAHGGKIAHRDTPGGGATFEIRFARQALLTAKG